MIKRYCTNFDNTPEVRNIVFSLLQMVHMLLNTPVSEPATVQCEESGSALMHVYLLDNGKLAECVFPKLNSLIMHIKDDSKIDSWVSLFSKSLHETHRMERLVNVLDTTMNKDVAWCLFYFINLAIQGHNSLFKRNAVSEQEATDA